MRNQPLGTKWGLTQSDIDLVYAMHRQGYRIKFILKRMPSAMPLTYLKWLLYSRKNQPRREAARTLSTLHAKHEAD